MSRKKNSLERHVNFFVDLDSISVHKHAKHELGQYAAILTSRLVTNPYILLSHLLIPLQQLSTQVEKDWALVCVAVMAAFMWFAVQVVVTGL